MQHLVENDFLPKFYFFNSILKNMIVHTNPQSVDNRYINVYHKRNSKLKQLLKQFHTISRKRVK